MMGVTDSTRTSCPWSKEAKWLAKTYGLVSFHALRHGNADTLKQKHVSIEIIDDISGRLSRGETSVRYTNAAGLPLVRSALANYPTVTGHLEPQPLQLLPWVAKRLSPPWAGRSRSQRLADARSVRSERAKTRRKLD